MRPRYWSCSNFADWVRGSPKPSAASHEEWDEWRKTAKEKHPVRFWLAEEGLDKVQTFCNYPRDLYDGVKYYISNRYIRKTHTLTSNLKPGEYYDLDIRILNCLFDELVTYVEIDVARWNGVKHRSAKAGTEYLAEDTALTYDEPWVDPGDELFGKPTPQAIASKEVLDLYHWWKNARPARADPHEVTGWGKLCDDVWKGELSRSSELYKAESKRMVAEIDAIEQKYLDEDTEMLIRLIKIRGYLWS